MEFSVCILTAELLLRVLEKVSELGILRRYPLNGSYANCEEYILYAFILLKYSGINDSIPSLKSITTPLGSLGYQVYTKFIIRCKSS